MFANWHILFLISPTPLLKDSLGKDAKAMVFLAVSPLEENLQETISTLTFGKVRMPRAHRVCASCLGVLAEPTGRVTLLMLLCYRQSDKLNLAPLESTSQLTN